MAIEDMSSPAWLEYQKRRQCDQNRRRAENAVPAPNGAIDERNDRAPGSSTPLEVSPGNDKGWDMEECRGVVPAIAHDKSLLQQVPHDDLAPPSPSTSSQRRGVKRKQEEASSSERPSTSSATSSSSRDAHSESIELADNRDDRSEESQSSGSLADFRDDASSPQEGAAFYAAVDIARVAANKRDHVPLVDAGPAGESRGGTRERTMEDASFQQAATPQHHPLDEDFLGQLWFSKKATAVSHQTAKRHTLIASCDLSALGGYKKFSSFADADAFVNYLERLRAEGVNLNHYECLDVDTPSKLYVDVDYAAEEKNDEDFQERFEHCEIMLRGFLEQIFLVPPEAIAFQVATAHGNRKDGSFKYSAHVCLQGFFLRDSSARVALKKALLFFLKKPPEQLRRSCEFLFYQEKKEGVSIDKCLLDPAVYSSFQNWRTLYSEKKGSGRPLKPAAGSSRDIADHLIGIYDPAGSAVVELDGNLLLAYNQRAEPLASVSRRPEGVPTGGLRGTFVERGAALHPLTGVEKDRLLRRYQKDHPGAWILRAEAMGEDMFTVHFGVPTPYCWIAGRAHSSPGNASGYLVYNRKAPSKAFYRCHSRSCSGTGNDRSGRRLQRVVSLDAECIENWSSDYEIVGRMRGYPIPNLRRDSEPQTTLVMANMGAGKSKELFHGLLPKVPPESSVCLIAPNIALARKYHEETKKEGLDFVCYLDESGFKITARRVVVCINSIARVLPHFDLVVMDEVNFTLTNMASTVMKDKKQVFLALEGIVASARAAFLCDAHLNCPRVVEWIQTLRHTSRFYTIRNRGVWPSSRKAVISPMPGPLVGRGQPKATYSLVVKRVLDLVASGKTVMVPATSKTFVELLENAFKARLPGKKLIAFHGAKREESDKMLLQHAISNPDQALIADCLAFTPTIGPGVSIEKKGSYDFVIGVAVNSDNHPDAQVLMQQIQRARDAGDIQIFYGELPSRRRVADPITKEEVFRMLESSDRELADLMQGVSVDHLDMLRRAPGERAIYDRSSATCNLYANNLLGRLQSRQYYVHLLTEDLRRQGVTVVNQLSMRPDEGGAGVVLVATEEPDETVEQWRERHLISWEQYEKIRGMLSSPSGGVTSQDVLRYEIFSAAVHGYGIEYCNVDREFMEVYVRGKHAKGLMTKFGNYERFVTSIYASTVDTLSVAVREGEETGNIQEYLDVRNRPANGVNYAWCVLAALTDVAADEIDNVVFGSFVIADGAAGGDRLTEVFDMDEFGMSSSLESLEALYWPRTSFVGKTLSEMHKRNVIKMILEGGLGLTIRLARFSHGVRQGSHKIVPVEHWKILDDQYGGLKSRLVEKRNKTCLVEFDE